ncbi:MAG: hypothetical protein WBC91_10750 [Phototrophicaceae bacterium]
MSKVMNFPAKAFSETQSFEIHKSASVSQTFERELPLTIWLGFQAIAILAIIAIAFTLNILGALNTGYFLTATVVSGSLQLIGISWLWDGKRRGYQTLLALYTIGIVLNLATGQFPQIVTNIVAIAILISIVQPKEQELS